MPMLQALLSPLHGSLYELAQPIVANTTLDLTSCTAFSGCPWRVSVGVSVTLMRA